MTPVTILVDSPAKRDKVVAWLAKVPVDEVLELSLRPYKPTRSQEQNKRYWLLVDKIAEHTGHDAQELHEMLKVKFLGVEERTLAGEHISAVRPSSKLKVSEFRDYSDRVEAWAVETLGVWLE
jgi:predicted secreted protein